MENNQLQTTQKVGRTSLQSVSESEKKLLQTVKSIDDLLSIQSQFVSITSLKLESPALSDTFIVSNMLYITSIVGIELNQAQQADILDEIGQVGWMTMADFKLFLDRMKKHKFYRRDYQELLQEFWKYADERLERAFEIESGKVDKSDDFPRTGEINHIRDLEVFRMNQIRKESEKF